MTISLAPRCGQFSIATAKGETQTLTTSQLISSAPLRDFVLKYLHPFASPPALEAASELQYRDFLTVALIVKDRGQFSDSWVYVHDTDVDVARIQNFKAWSKEMVPDQSMNCYGMEYFCFNGDSLWIASDNQLIQKAKTELARLGLARADDVIDGCVVRQPKAYPVYDQNYRSHVAIIRHELETKFPSLHFIGHNGLHKYNNQDQAMMTAMLTVKNIMAGERRFDVWRINQEGDLQADDVLNPEKESSLSPA